ncbi:MAG TPA: hypothetical protein VLT59_05305 [Steroidobacteraceae bacterium]|nr:hypothetical protein [Steroidobacteraceae bacterium]
MRTGPALQKGPPRFSTATAAALRERYLRPARSASGALELSTYGLDALVGFEIGSRAWYLQRLTTPHWPGGESGVTVGIGYDLGYQSMAQLRADWLDVLGDAAIARLAAALGVTGARAKSLVAQLTDLRIGLDEAAAVFYQSTLPRYARRTSTTYPAAGTLPPDATSMLVSLVYNRGSRLTGDSRREMRAIRGQSEARDLPAIAQSLRSMKRLWPTLRGLVRRREREAEIVEQSDRAYSAAELVWI